MHTGLSLCFDRHSTIGSSSTESRQTAKITSAMSSQHLEQKHWSSMHNECPQETEEVRKATKAKASAFLQKIQDGMTHEVNTHVRLAELEDITAKPNEDPQELVAHIKTIMDRCKMLNDAHQEHELCRRIVVLTKMMYDCWTSSWRIPLRLHRVNSSTSQ